MSVRGGKFMVSDFFNLVEGEYQFFISIRTFFNQKKSLSSSLYILDLRLDSGNI